MSESSLLVVHSPMEMTVTVLIMLLEITVKWTMCLLISVFLLPQDINAPKTRLNKPHFNTNTPIGAPMGASPGLGVWQSPLCVCTLLPLFVWFIMSRHSLECFRQFGSTSDLQWWKQSRWTHSFFRWTAMTRVLFTAYFATLCHLGPKFSLCSCSPHWLWKRLMEKT